MRTSPPHAADLERRYPMLTAWRRTATRLHPRPGDPGTRDSSVGGPLLWPAGEDWPVCAADDHDEDPSTTVADVRTERLLLATRDQAARRGEDTAEVAAKLKALWSAKPTPPAGPRPLIGLAQLYLRDVPLLRHPEGADLLQLLWCPYQHTEAGYLPRVRLLWRDSAAITATAPDPSPQLFVGDEDFVPECCAVYPEAVTEHAPSRFSGLKPRGDDVDRVASQLLARGWKVGGWGGYCGVVDPTVPDCACGAATTAFLTVGNGEWSDDFGSWRPVEDADFTPTPRHPTGGDPVQTNIGRGYVLQLFGCVTGFDCPVTVAMT